jgi:hypothetical protein
MKMGFYRWTGKKSSWEYEKFNATITEILKQEGLKTLFL